MRYSLLILISLLLHISVYGRNRIASIEELNRTPHTLNSHTECEQRSSLEMDFSSMRILTNEELDKRGPAIHCKKGIQYGTLHLNHDIAALRLTVKIDGKNSEWGHDEALFVGSDSPSQMLLRAAYDDENIYLLVECKSDDREAFARVDINTSHSLLITRKGCSGVKGLKAKCRKAETTTAEKGFAAEVAIPRKQLQGALSIWCAITANGISDTLSVANKNDIASLPQIVLK